LNSVAVTAGTNFDCATNLLLHPTDFALKSASTDADFGWLRHIPKFSLALIFVTWMGIAQKIFKVKGQ